MEGRDLSTYTPFGTFAFNDIEIDSGPFRPERVGSLPKVCINDNCQSYKDNSAREGRGVLKEASPKDTAAVKTPVLMTPGKVVLPR